MGARGVRGYGWVPGGLNKYRGWYKQAWWVAVGAMSSSTCSINSRGQGHIIYGFRYSMGKPDPQYTRGEPCWSCQMDKYWSSYGQKKSGKNFFQLWPIMPSFSPPTQWVKNCGLNICKTLCDSSTNFAYFNS